MKRELFEETLRTFLHTEPFRPFVVEMLDGRRIAIDHPAVAMSGGGAGFISESEGLVDFTCEEVRAIELLTPEPSA